MISRRSLTAIQYPEAKSAALWLRHGWFEAVALVVSSPVLVAVMGWHPAGAQDDANQSLSN